MPLVRLKVRNEFGLGRPELYGNGTVEDEDPKAVLGGVAVAGFVGILRQLGDLAEFAAEVFHGIQDQVTVTASRSQKLTNRVRRIESALSPLEKAVLSQTSHIHFAYTSGCEWHPVMQNGQNHFIYNDLPSFVMESYEQCRDPPRLHLLDKFDAGGPGSCLRRYTDPTFFRKELRDPITAGIKVQKDKSFRKKKKKRLSQRNIPRSRLASTSEETSGTHPNSLNDDRQSTSQSTSTNGMACISNMQKLSDELGQSHMREQSDEQEQSDVEEPSKNHDLRNDSGFIEYLIHQNSSSEHEERLSEGLLAMSPQHADSMSLGECNDIVDDNVQFCPYSEQPESCAPSNAWDENKENPDSLFEQNIEDEEASEMLNETQNQRGFAKMDILFDEVDTVQQELSRRQLNNIETIPQCDSEGENQWERGSETESRSEADEYADARNTIESESDNDLDGQPKQNLERFLGDVNIHYSKDVSEENKDKSTDIPFEHMTQDMEYDHSNEKSCSLSYLRENERASNSLSVPVPEETVISDKNFEEPGDSVGAFCLSLAEAFPVEKILQEKPVATYMLTAETFSGERISPEESGAMYLSIAEAVPHKDLSPMELVTMHPPLAEAYRGESPEEPIAMDQSLEKAIPQDKISREEPVTTCLFSEEASLHERISPEESITMSPLAEAFPLKIISSEELVDTYPLLTKAFPCVLSEEPVVATDLPLAEPVPHENFSAKEPVPMYPSAEAILDERISPKESFDTLPFVAEAVPHEKISLEESIALDPLLAEALPDKGILPEEPFAMDLSLGKAIPHDIICLEEQEQSDSTYPSLAEAVPYGKVLPEASDATCYSDGDHATDKPLTESGVSTNKKSICDRLKPETIPQVPGYDLTDFETQASTDVDINLKVESLAPFGSLSISGNTELDANCPLRGGAIQSRPEARESLSSDTCVESVTIWSNGSLLGLEPSKPPVFAVPNSVNGDIRSKNNGEMSFIANEKEPSDDPGKNNKVSDSSSVHSSRLGQSNESPHQNTAISFGVFDLSHRLLMNGFRRNLPACNYEALPANLNTEEAMDDYRETCGVTFDDPFVSDSLFDSPTSSPPLQHMTISFRPIDGLSVSKLKLKIPSQIQGHGREVDTFPLFQLVPDTASPHNNGSESDDDNDTFCRSSPCKSVSCRSEYSASDSELWESDGNPEKNNGNVYEELCRISPGDSVLSIEQVGIEPSFLDIPCFDIGDTISGIRETQNGSYDGIPAELLGSVEHDNVPIPYLCGSRVLPHALPDSKITTASSVTDNGNQCSSEEAASTSEAKQQEPSWNNNSFSLSTKPNTSVVLERPNTMDQVS